MDAITFWTDMMSMYHVDLGNKGWGWHSWFLLWSISNYWTITRALCINVYDSQRKNMSDPQTSSFTVRTETRIHIFLLPRWWIHWCWISAVFQFGTEHANILLSCCVTKWHGLWDEAMLLLQVLKITPPNLEIRYFSPQDQVSDVMSF